MNNVSFDIFTFVNNFESDVMGITPVDLDWQI